MAYDWPGNIRELKNSLERAVVLSRGKGITPESFGHHRLSRENGGIDDHKADTDTCSYPMNWPLEQVERSHIQRVLSHFKGHRRLTAESLGISERDLYYKIKKLSLKDS